jgi:hypothetical protein
VVGAWNAGPVGDLVAADDQVAAGERVRVSDAVDDGPRGSGDIDAAEHAMVVEEPWRA